MEKDKEKDNGKYVTTDQCSAFRQGYNKEIHEQDIDITMLKTEVGIFKTLVFSILGTLVAGFAGTIFSILSLK